MSFSFWVKFSKRVATILGSFVPFLRAGDYLELAGVQALAGSFIIKNPREYLTESGSDLHESLPSHLLGIPDNNGQIAMSAYSFPLLSRN